MAARVRFMCSNPALERSRFLPRDTCAVLCCGLGPIAARAVAFPELVVGLTTCGGVRTGGSPILDPPAVGRRLESQDRGKARVRSRASRFDSKSLVALALAD